MTIRSKIGSKDKALTEHKQVNSMFDKTRSKKLIVQQLDLLFKVDFDAIKISVLPKLLITMKCLNYADYTSLFLKI